MQVIDPVSAYASGVFVSSNVPETDYAAYNPATSYALDDYVNDNTNHLIYKSLANANLGNALTDETKWLEISATNRFKMFDAANNTQTSNADSISFVLYPQQIVGGLFLGGLDGNSVNVVMNDPTDGQVYSRTTSLIVSNSDSSMFNWFFRRIRRRTYFLITDLPPYFSGSVTVTITKTGSTAKCGMVALGALDEYGRTQYGLGAEFKDFSSSRFNSDGTSETTLRGFAKKMSMDVEVDNTLVDWVFEEIANYRQRNLVIIGSGTLGLSIVYGKIVGMKVVVPYQTVSKMAAQIEGVV